VKLSSRYCLVPRSRVDSVVACLCLYGLDMDNVVFYHFFQVAESCAKYWYRVEF
jgi:hypothetical protein